jgi:hypothetical protein
MLALSVGSVASMAAVPLQAPSPFCAQVVSTKTLMESLPDAEVDVVVVKAQALTYVAEHAKIVKLAPDALKADYKISSTYWAFQKQTWLKVNVKKPGALDAAATKLVAYKGLKQYFAAAERLNVAIAKVCNFPPDES